MTPILRDHTRNLYRIGRDVNDIAQAIQSMDPSVTPSEVHQLIAQNPEWNEQRTRTQTKIAQHLKEQSTTLDLVDPVDAQYHNLLDRTRSIATSLADRMIRNPEDIGTKDLQVLVGTIATMRNTQRDIRDNNQLSTTPTRRYESTGLPSGMSLPGIGTGEERLEGLPPAEAPEETPKETEQPQYPHEVRTDLLANLLDIGAANLEARQTFPEVTQDTVPEH